MLNCDSQIEYIEADGVMMFHLDFEQNPERHCNGESWPQDLTQAPMIYTNQCQSKNSEGTFSGVTPDRFPDTQEYEYEPECHGTWGDCSADPTVDECCNVHRGLNWTRAGT